MPVRIKIDAGSYSGLFAAAEFSAAVTIGGGIKIWGGIPTDIWNKIINKVDVPGRINSAFTLPFQSHPDSMGVEYLVNNYYSGIFVLKDGKVLGWGNNSDGELGDGTLTSAGFGEPVPTLGISLK